MNNILEEYLKITENEPSLSEKLRESMRDGDGHEFDEQVYERVREITEHPDDIANAWKKRSEMYPEVDDGELTIVDTPVTPVIRRAYCPDCGAEIVTRGFERMGAMSGKNQVLYTCPSCHTKMRINREYPRIEYLNSAKEHVSLHNVANLISPW